MSEIRKFDSGATRHDNADKLDYEGFLSPAVLREFARYMHEHRKQADGSLRASDNWQKGIPVKSYQESLIRHVLAAWALWRGCGVEKELIGGVEREPTLIECLMGIIFNAQGMTHELLKQAQQAAQPLGVARLGAASASGVASNTSEVATPSSPVQTPDRSVAERCDRQTTLSRSGRPSRAEAWKRLDDLKAGTVLFQNPDPAKPLSFDEAINRCRELQKEIGG